MKLTEQQIQEIILEETKAVLRESGRIAAGLDWMADRVPTSYADFFGLSWARAAWARFKLRGVDKGLDEGLEALEKGDITAFMSKIRERLESEKNPLNPKVAKRARLYVDLLYSRNLQIIDNLPEERLIKVIEDLSEWYRMGNVVPTDSGEAFLVKIRDIYRYATKGTKFEKMNLDALRKQLKGDPHPQNRELGKVLGFPGGETRHVGPIDPSAVNSKNKYVKRALVSVGVLTGGAVATTVLLSRWYWKVDPTPKVGGAIISLTQDPPAAEASQPAPPTSTTTGTTTGTTTATPAAATSDNKPSTEGF